MMVQLQAVTKRYGSRGAATMALDAVTLGFGRGSFTAVMGPSGSGKSTLLHCAAGLDRPTSGSVTLDGMDLAGLSERALTRLRRERVGFVFQSFNLLPTLNAGQNIQLPIELAGRKPDREWFEHVVGVLGIADRLNHLPAQLSGGQQQRVACARALLSRPDVTFADEPTGNLDSRSGADLLGFLRRSVCDLGQTIVMVTHDPNAASYADRVILLADGSLVGELTKPTAA